MNLSSRSLIPSIDSRVDVPVEKDEAVEKALAQYMDKSPVTEHMPPDDLYAHYASLNPPVLAPAQIDLVLQHLIRVPHEYRWSPSVYASVLIQRSYDAGHNGFVLHTQNILLDEVCSRLHGKEHALLNMTVYGDTGDETGKKSTWCSFMQEGNAGDEYFMFAENATLLITGRLGDDPLNHSWGILFKTMSRATFDQVRKSLGAYYNVNDPHLMLLSPKGKIIDEHPEPWRPME